MDVGATVFLVGLAGAWPLASWASNLWTPVFLVTPNAPVSDEHFEHIRHEMKRRGPPTLRAVRYTEVDGTIVWRLLEGSHRAHVALADGVRIRLVEVRPDEVVETDAFERGEWTGPRPAAWFESYWSAPITLRFPRRQVKRVRTSRLHLPALKSWHMRQHSLA